MLPLITFASGLVLGIAGVRLARSAKTTNSVKSAVGSAGVKARQGFDQAKEELREATVSGLTSVEKASASLRDKLKAAPKADVPKDDAGEAAKAPESAAETKP